MLIINICMSLMILLLCLLLLLRLRLRLRNCHQIWQVEIKSMKLSSNSEGRGWIC